MSVTMAASRHRLLRVTADHWKLTPAPVSRHPGRAVAPTREVAARAPALPAVPWPLLFAV